MLDENSKPNENIKFSGKSKYVKKYKSTIIIILAYNSTFYFLQDLKQVHKNNYESILIGT